MSIFQKIIFPFSNTGAVCYLYEYENTLSHRYLNEQTFLHEVENFQIREIGSVVFYGFTKEEKLDYYKRKLELHGLHGLTIPYFKTPNLTHSSLPNCIRDLELLTKFVEGKNFAFCYPHSKEYEVLEYVVCAILYLDLEMETNEILDYFIDTKKLTSETIERIEFFSHSLKKFYSPILKKFIFPVEKNDSKVEPTQDLKVKAGELELNLSSLNGNSSLDIKQEEIIQKLNLNSLGVEEDTFENPLELLEDVLDFAESFEEKEEVDDWKEAFPDTGKKIENNKTSSDNLQSSKETEILKPEEQIEEDYTFSTLIDLDAITESYISLEDSKEVKENANEIESSPSLESIAQTTNEDTQEDLFSHDDFNLEIKLDFTSEEMKTVQVEVEIDSDPSFDTLDRQIKDALTKELILEEEDPRKKKESHKKESKPMTIIVTPEKKEEKLTPLSKERLESLKEEFNAIQLD